MTEVKAGLHRGETQREKETEETEPNHNETRESQQKKRIQTQEMQTATKKPLYSRWITLRAKEVVWKVQKERICPQTVNKNI